MDTRSWSGSPRQPQLMRPRHWLVPRPLSPTASCQDRNKSPPARNHRRPVYPAGGHHVSRRTWRSRRPSHLWAHQSPKTCKALFQEPGSIPSCYPRALTASLGQSNTCTCQPKPRVLTDAASYRAGRALPRTPLFTPCLIQPPLCPIASEHVSLVSHAPLPRCTDITAV
jgi:hypothetical protein